MRIGLYTYLCKYMFLHINVYVCICKHIYPHWQAEFSEKWENAAVGSWMYKRQLVREVGAKQAAQMIKNQELQTMKDMLKLGA